MARHGFENWYKMGSSARVSRTALAFTTLWVFLGLGGCSSIESTMIDGRRVGEMSGEDVIAAARGLIDVGLIEEGRDVALYAVTSFIDPSIIENGRFLAGQAEEALEDYPAAFRHYRLLLEARTFSRYRTPILEERIFAIGRILFEMDSGWFSDRSRCVEVFNFFAAQYPRSPNTDDALQLVAQYYFDEEEFDLAIERYQKLYATFPEREWRKLAQFRIGECYVSLCPGWMYDRVLMLRARHVFTDYLREYPEGQGAELALELRAKVEAWLSRRELAQADLYRLRDQDRGERIHLSNIMLLFPDTEWAPEARERLASRGWDHSVHSIDTFDASGGMYGDPYDENWVGLSGAAEPGFF